MYIYTCAVATIWHRWSIVFGICRLPIHTTPALRVRCWLLVARSESHLTCRERLAHKRYLLYAL